MRGFVLPNRLVNPIILGNRREDDCRLLFLVADVVEDKTTENGAECSADHSHAELDNDLHRYHLPPQASIPAGGAAVWKLYQSVSSRASD